MKTAMLWLGALVSCAVSAGLARAGNNAFYSPCPPCPLNAFNPPYRPADYRCAPPAPDACRPGSFCTGPCGMVYGPNYNLTPPFPPFNGARPPMKHGVPTHPFARSPRDFFMLD